MKSEPIDNNAVAAWRSCTAVEGRWRQVAATIGCPA